MIYLIIDRRYDGCWPSIYSDENLEYYRKVADRMEREANDMGYGPIKHLPAPPAPGFSGNFWKESTDGTGWTAHQTMQVSPHLSRTNSRIMYIL